MGSKDIEFTPGDRIILMTSFLMKNVFSGDSGSEFSNALGLLQHFTCWGYRFYTHTHIPLIPSRRAYVGPLILTLP